MATKMVTYAAISECNEEFYRVPGTLGKHCLQIQRAPEGILLVRGVRLCNPHFEELHFEGAIPSEVLAQYEYHNNKIGYWTDEVQPISRWIALVKGDVLVYNCGSIHRLKGWRKEVYNLVGYFPIEIVKEVPKSYDEGEMWDTRWRSSSGTFVRKETDSIAVRYEGLGSHELFSWGTGYIGGIFATSPQEALKWVKAHPEIKGWHRVSIPILKEDY